MTNTATTTKKNAARNFAPPVATNSDQAPMLVTRLSGWIGVDEAKPATPSWIVPTRMRSRN